MSDGGAETEELLKRFEKIFECVRLAVDETSCYSVCECPSNKVFLYSCCFFLEPVSHVRFDGLQLDNTNLPYKD